MKDIKVGDIDSKPKPKANVQLRPYYAATDKKFVQYLFYSTYFNLVPRAVRLRIKTPTLLATWIGIYAILVGFVPDYVSKLGWSPHLKLGIQIIITIVVFGLGLIGLLWYADKFDITQRVLEGIENDLREPDVYYRGTPQNPREGNFWVLTVNDDIVGCIGIDHTPVPVMDQSTHAKPYVRASERPRAVDAPEIHQAKWKKTALILAKLDDMVRLTLVGALDILRDGYLKLKGGKQTPQQKVLFEAHKPNEASIRRLAVKLECQNHGLSTVLLKRAAFWAHAHQVEYLYADVDELQEKGFVDILTKRHGYTFVSKKKLGYYRTKSTYRLDVKLWMSQELERRKQEQLLEEQAKEDEELKQYE
ncbi:hypothetical protein A0J61_06058 [Choanephora cucurbitarum]|uniref:N-acetyltransferase domain-containing protein n=1 Tax=Choanephora cucurbitarum TaxID=101091 RepID=A0A1C7N9T4_9FUNG|nr:hypothetical protein A0J61_06058 [Choanephora cucurbitarum]